MTEGSISENPGNCYIYGSVHIRKPSKELLEYADKLVDYVLIEGVHNKSKLSPGFIAYWFTAYAGLIFVFKLEKLLSRLTGHRGDMEEIKVFFEKRGKRVEVADRDIRSVIEYCFRKTRRWQPLLPLLWVVWGVFFFGIVSQISLNLCHFLTFTICLLVRIVLLVFLFIPLLFGFLIIYLYAFTLSKDCMIYRDEMVVKRLVELIREHNVLIVRGRRHVHDLKKELEKHGIKCQELEIE